MKDSSPLMRTDYLDRLWSLMRAYQCTYYVDGINIIHDLHFDKLEKFLQSRGYYLPVGSDRSEDYSPLEQWLACKLVIEEYERHN